MNKSVIKFIIKQHAAGKKIGRKAIGDMFDLSDPESRIYAYISKHIPELIEVISDETIDVRILNESMLRPNVLIIDIETSLMSCHVWRCGKQYVGPDQIIEDWHMLSWSAKWLMESDVYSDVLTKEESREHNDKRISKSIWSFIDKADIVIAHNARGFDVPKINTRFICHGMAPPRPYLVIDTLIEFRKVAKFSSNKQDELCKKLGLARKVEHEGYDLWIKCFADNRTNDVVLQEGLDTMLKYNEGDIMGLEELYLYIRPWIKSHPNMGLFVEGDGSKCPACGSIDITWDDGFYVTKMNKYSTFRCSCGAIGHAPKSESALGRMDNSKLLSTNAR
jgi:hypothetical protein